MHLKVDIEPPIRVKFERKSRNAWLIDVLCKLMFISNEKTTVKNINDCFKPFYLHDFDPRPFLMQLGLT